MAPAPSTSFVELFALVLAGFGVDLGAWLRGWARIAPTLLLVPLFGGSALPAPARAGLGFALTLAAIPALRPVGGATLPNALELTAELGRGLPVAIGAALLLHAALMAGGTIDDLRGGRESAALPVFEGATTPVGTLLGLLVALGLFELGAPARLVAALFAPSAAVTPLVTIVSQIAAAVGFAVAAAAPLAAAAVVVGVGEALMARAALPAHVSQLLAPLRGVALLAVTALVLDRIVAVLVAGF